MNHAEYHIAINDQLVEVVLKGTFTLTDVVAYEKELRAAVSDLVQQKWAIIADIKKLEVSTMEAIEYTKKITNWILSHGCVCLVNVKEDRNVVVDHQVAIAAAGFPIYEVNSFEQGRTIAEKHLR